MNYSLTEIAQIVDGQLIKNNPNVTVQTVVFDGRQANHDTLFIPITWGNDGHNFIQGAIDNGIVATLWAKDHPHYPNTVPVILVSDTLKAYQQLAKHYLQQVAPKVVAISGSNGKTTTKDFIAAIGATKYRTAKTPQNFNNELGVPQTILNMPADTELLVIELGMDHPDDLDVLSKLVTPDIAVLTMIGEAHIEFFKTRARIADGKMQIVNGLKPQGTLVYNGDEPLLLERAQQHAQLQTTTFGLQSTNNFYAIEQVSHQMTAEFKTNQSGLTFKLPLSGSYNISNALAAIAVGHLLAIDDQNIQIALENATITQNRTEWLQMPNGTQILSDVYNSNPTAVQSVLTSFHDVKTTGHRYVVLGDMLELGEKGPSLHANLAPAIANASLQAVFLIGPLMENLAERLRVEQSSLAVFHFAATNQTALIQQLKANLQPDDLVLIKASHGLHLEKVVEALLAD